MPAPNAQSRYAVLLRKLSFAIGRPRGLVLDNLSRFNVRRERLYEAKLFALRQALERGGESEVDTESGTRIAHRFVLLAVGLPLFFVLVGAYLTSLNVIAPSHLTALVVSSIALVLLVLMRRMAGHFNAIEMGLHRQSFIDVLTQICNLRGFQLLGDQALRSSLRRRVPLTVLYFDLDGLKATNDRFGHPAGSSFLVEMAELLKETFRGSDIVARVGGDEFAVVTNTSRGDSAVALARLARATDARNALGRQPYRISYSMGEASSTGLASDTLMQIVERADLAMYRDKDRKRPAPLREDPVD